MKIKNIENPEEFLKIIDSCKGRVELITDDGDRLNLKSKLCQLVSLSTIFSSDLKSQKTCCTLNLVRQVFFINRKNLLI